MDNEDKAATIICDSQAASDNIREVLEEDRYTVKNGEGAQYTLLAYR